MIRAAFCLRREGHHIALTSKQGGAEAHPSFEQYVRVRCEPSGEVRLRRARGPGRLFEPWNALSSDAEVGVIALARHIADNPRFQHFILVVIVAGAVIIGVETSAALTARFSSIITALEIVIQTIFVVEIAIRILACWPRPLAFFANGWNVFDFAVVAASLLPQAGAFAMVGRVARLMRVTRVISTFPELRLIIGTMLRSVPSMGHVIVLLSLLLYVYAVVGFHFFREADPARWGSLGPALLTLFQMLTLEGWVEIQAAVVGAQPWAWIYFISFVFVAVFVVVNLFIAVVINNLESVRHEQQLDADRGNTHHELLAAIETARERLVEVEARLRAIPPESR